jgi:surface antigen
MKKSFWSMRPATAAVVAVLATTMLGAASAQAQQYGTFGTDNNSCDRSALSQILSTSKGNLVGSIGGAALGGLLGNQIGKGSGNTVATILGVVGGALAGGYIGRQMDPTDQACVGQTLEHAPSNQTVSWHNPDNDSSYWVTPTNSYQGQNGMPCRNYVTQAVVNGQRQQGNAAACRDQNGQWQPVNARAPAGSPPPAPPAYSNAVAPDTVFQVQQRLHDLGFYVRDNIDGKWGRNTSLAVGNFQRSRGLPATGQLDQQTLSELGVAAN